MQNDLSTIDLGWTSLNEDSFQDTEEFYLKLYSRYGWIFLGKESELHRYGRYQLATPYYISEIEDLMRYALILFDKIVIEVPISDEHLNKDDSAFVSGLYVENRIYAECSFFSMEALTHVKEKFGNAIEGKEIVLLPTFDSRWDETDFDEESGDYTIGAESWALESHMKAFNYAWPRLEECQQTEFQDSLVDQAVNAECSTSLPILVGGNIKDIISLRRDEYESFSRWRNYLDEVKNSSSHNEKDIGQAIMEGLNDLNDRIKLLKRKGLLDALGTSLISASLISAVCYGSGVMTIPAMLAALSGVPPAIKTIIEQRAEQKKIAKGDLYFLWLTKKLKGWK